VDHVQALPGDMGDLEEYRPEAQEVEEAMLIEQ
jgi:hypothetical protein